MKYSKLIYFLMFIVSVQLFVAKYYQIGFQADESADLESVNGKATRTTELGTPIPSAKKPEKEVEIILKDPAISQAWGLQMTDAQKAWRVSLGSRDVVVAIVDTGVD